MHMDSYSKQQEDFKGREFQDSVPNQSQEVTTLTIDPASLISTACWGLFFQPAGIH